MPFINQFINNCNGCEVFSFMDGFSSYNQIEITLEDQHKTSFIYPWGIFAYQNLSFGLLKSSATFQRAMSYAFHDIKHIVQPYLDDVPTKLGKCKDHLDYLRQFFMHCRYYNIHLNPHKCIQVVESTRLLGFIVSKSRMRVDPLNVEAIMNLPPPCSIVQLQSLQGKANFLHHFISNYIEIMKGFI